jgi:hypothetical protein
VLKEILNFKSVFENNHLLPEKLNKIKSLSMTTPFKELSPLSSVQSLLCDQHHFVPQHHSCLLRRRSLVYQHDLRGENWVPTVSRARKDVDALDRIPFSGDPGIQSRVWPRPDDNINDDDDDVLATTTTGSQRCSSTYSIGRKQFLCRHSRLTGNAWKSRLNPDHHHHHL